MYGTAHILLVKFWKMMLFLLVLLNAVLIFSLLMPTKGSNSVAANGISNDNLQIDDSANVITNGMTKLVGGFAGTLASAGEAVDRGGQSVADAVSHSGGFVKNGLQSSVLFVGHGVSSGALVMARSASKSFAFISEVPGTIVNFATDAANVGDFIKPSENIPLPQIDPVPTATVASAPAVAPAAAPAATETAVSQATPTPDSTPTWPIHGAITTPFGVPHWPYQPIHTGIDISDGRRSGITEIKPFKPGRVIDVESSKGGLGNHVTVDHGEGVTSVYGHLASISVQVGQAVDKTTTLGLEGSTGASTGTHLHLEIRLNGQPKDPHLFISGQP